MSIDDQTSALEPGVPLSVRGPAQRAITEFLAAHRTRPERGLRARIFGVSPLAEHTADAYFSALGQLRVSAALGRLGSQWRIFHGVPGAAPEPGGGETWIDHVVIGPPGIFTVTAYDHTRHNVWVDHRAFVVDGHRLQYIRAAEVEVGHIERMLGEAIGETLTASAVIAVIDPGSLQVGDLPPDVSVIAAAGLLAHLRAGDRKLDADLIQRLADTMNSLNPPAGGTSCVDDDDESGNEEKAAAHDRAEFARVRREVATARVVRALWTIGTAAVLAAIFVTIGIQQLVAGRAIGW